MTDSIQLPASVAHITLGNKNIYLVGTAHVSKQSVEDVRTTVELLKPDSICVELCQGRYNTMTQKDAWEKMDIFKIIKQKKAVFLLMQLVMTSFYRKLGDQFEVQPGAEMLEGIQQAEETGAQLVLADRNIEITLKRVWGYLGFWNKMKLMFNLLMTIFTNEKIDEQAIEKMKQQDQLESIMAEFAKSFPEIKHRLLDERDIYLAQKIRAAPGDKIVAVVGAGHITGIKQHIQEDESLDELLKLPPPSKISAVLTWSIPVMLVVLLVIGFFKGGAECSMQSVYIWILVTGSLAAIGAAVALAHPLTIIASFIAAPFTTLHPFIAVGWIAGLVQAWVKKPTVADFENLPDAISTLKGFWTNPVTRILIVVATSNLGASLGTFIATGWIATRVF
jgi:pheromone shutdown-related protein TraB